ncbi:M56 family metallopeptidase [Pseudoalteromonas spongiae]|uniref:M56 family metallopeptidase n=1 Tax=Pseudoalteromonas spongiae TaxID=298657 RepID=A0ABU8ES88_9GAMM
MMINYILINLLFSISALLIHRNCNLSARVAVPLLFAALISWCIPYDLLVNWMSNLNANNTFIILSTQTSNAISNANSYIYDHSLSLLDYYQLLLIIGALTAAYKALKFILWSNSIHALCVKDEVLSEDFGHPIYRTAQQNPGLLVGFLKPIILIDSDLKERDLLELTINHELTHIAYRDHLIIFASGLISYLFFWNPFVRKLVQQTKLAIEQRCDEKTALNFETNEYLLGLAQLIKHYQKPESFAFNATLVNSKHQGITRLIYLKEKKMLTKLQKSIIGLLALVTSILTSTLVLAQVGKAESVQQPRQGVALKIKTTYQAEEDSIYTQSTDVLSDFDKPVSLEVNDELNTSFKYTIKDLGQTALIDIAMSINEEVVATPKLEVLFGNTAEVRIDNLISLEVSPSRAMINNPPVSQLDLSVPL